MKEKIEFYNDLKDKSNMEKAFEIYGDRLLGFINSYLKDIRLAEDIMMDVFVELLVRCPVFENEAQFRAYVFKVAKNKSINSYKSGRRLVKLDEESLKDTSELENTIFSGELDKKLSDAMEKLNFKYREVLYLSYFEDMSIEEVSQVLGIKQKSAINLKHRAKKKLNEVLKKANLRFEFKEEK